MQNQSEYDQIIRELKRISKLPEAKRRATAIKRAIKVVDLMIECHKQLGTPQYEIDKDEDINFMKSCIRCMKLPMPKKRLIVTQNF